MPSWLTGLSSNPIWTQSNAVLGVGHGLLNGAAFNDPNVGWTNQALGRLVAQDWLHFTIPWWNPYSGIGLPLAGEMQPAAMFLPFVLLLRWQGGIVWLEIVLQIFAGLATYALLRRLDLGRLTALVGGLLYAFSGTFACVPGETILNVMPFLPLLLHGIEDARDFAHRHRAVVLTGLGIGGSILAGFPETAYIDGLFGLLWALFRLLQTRDRARFATLVAVGGFCGLLVAAPQIVAFADFSIASRVFQAHGMGDAFIPLRGLAMVVLPNVYGVVGSYLGSHRLLSISWGLEGYVGALLVLFGIAGLMSRRDRPLALMLALWLAISIGKTFGVQPIAMAVDLLPFMKQTLFWRYSSPSWEFALIVLTGFAFEDLRQNRARGAVPFVATVAVVAVAAWFASPWAPIWHWHGKNLVYLTAWFERAVGFAFGGVALAALAWYGLRGGARRWALGAILVLNSFVLFVVPQFSGRTPGRVDLPAINYLKSRLHLRRFYTLWPIQPNYGAYFGIPSLNHNYLPSARSWSGYIHDRLAPEVGARDGNIFVGIFQPFGPAAAIHDLIRFHRNYSALGVRYVVTLPGTTLSPGISFPPDGPGAQGAALYQGHSIVMRARAPALVGRLAGVRQVGVYQGTYGNASNGTASIRLCAGGVCGIGQAALKGSPDNGPLKVMLDRSIPLRPGERYTVTITHIDGTNPDAIWMYPTREQAISVTGPDGRPMPGRAMRLLFTNPLPPGLLTRVYSDPAMDIWRLGGAAPFYTASAGCTVAAPRLDGATVTCVNAGRMVRRELFMAGWRATDNGAPVNIDAEQTILQSVPLHPGRNELRFAFAPPYTGYAWIGFWIGVAALAFETARGIAGRRRGSA